jgi:hypothetical protein
LLSDGPGEELRKYIHEFREGFAFKGSFDSNFSEAKRIIPYPPG